MFPVQTFRRLGISPVTTFNALLEAIDRSLHAGEIQQNVDRLALNAGHEWSPKP
jgi:hypothetical protein